MVILRVLLITMVSGGAIFGMEDLENMSRQRVDINTLLEAVETNNIELIESYIKNGGNIDAKGTIPASQYLPKKKEMTLLMTAAFYGRPKLMKILIQHSAQLNCINMVGDTALMMAARIQYTSLVQLLINAGADKDMRNKNGKTAFDEARDSLVRPLYSNHSKRYGKNRSFSIMTKLLKNREDDTTASIQTHINCEVVKIDDRRTTTPSLRYSSNAIEYYEPMMNIEYSPKMLMHNMRATIPHIIGPNHYIILSNNYGSLGWSR